ncbi:TonB-dependent receptor [Brevundimonas lutea]|uniref:TonB-dependent receptor n=1 Tax=Brevundimonas lutea TaxID=2293980 RepID=UPI000F0331E5|nr:TonB-dependent receptor [Brevundimonas lutea]
MTRLVKCALLSSAAWGVLAAGAVAQEAGGDPQATQLEEIVVTARRTEESLQRTPLSVSAFSEATLERLGATEVTDLQGAVPNLNLVQGRGSSDATNIYIRGIGQPDALQTFDPAVGVYVDDVYYSRIRGTQLDLLDLERVEVLRGPQGTLYGKNTIGGAMKLVTRRPDSGPYLNASATIGEYSEMEARISGGAPISDTWALGGAFMVAKRDGYVSDPVLDREYNDEDTIAGRVSAAWTPSDTFRLDLTADYTRQRPSMTVGRSESAVFTTDLALGTVTVRNPAPAPGSEFDYSTRTTPGLPNETPLDHWGLSAIAEWTLSDSLTLKSITAYRDLGYDDYIDIDATQFEMGDVLVAVDQDQFSQEFQLNFDNGGPITGVAGVYYLDEGITSHQEAYGDDLFTVLGLPVQFLRTIDDDLQTTSWAAYANATWAVTDALRLSGGLRYTKEEKDYDRTTTTFWDIPATGIPALDAAFAGFNADPSFAFQVQDDWSDVSPMASVDYQIDDNAMVYARVAKGFKSGGFNGRANNPGEQQPYDPETVTSFEVGAKTEWFDRRLRANVAAFHNDYQDFQARVSDCVDDATVPGGNCTIALTVLNAGELEIRGAELELSANPTPALQLDAQVGWLDAEYGEFNEVRVIGGVETTIDRSWQTPAFSPEWTARFGANYLFDLGANGLLTVGGQANYRSRMALAVDNADIFTRVEFPGMFQDDYWLYDARVAWETQDGRYAVTLNGKNLGEEVYRTDAQEFSAVGGIRTAYYGAPRTVSLTLTARY